MEGNLCRCGTYQRIRRAIARAAGAGQLTAEEERQRQPARPVLVARRRREARVAWLGVQIVAVEPQVALGPDLEVAGEAAGEAHVAREAVD